MDLHYETGQQKKCHSSYDTDTRRTFFNQKTQSLAASVENLRGRKSVCVFILVNIPKNTIFGHGNTAEADCIQAGGFQATLAGKEFPSQASGFHLGGYTWSGRLFYELHLRVCTYDSLSVWVGRAECLLYIEEF